MRQAYVIGTASVSITNTVTAKLWMDERVSMAGIATATAVAIPDDPIRSMVLCGSTVANIAVNAPASARIAVNSVSYFWPGFKKSQQWNIIAIGTSSHGMAINAVLRFLDILFSFPADVDDRILGFIAWMLIMSYGACLCNFGAIEVVP